MILVYRYSCKCDATWRIQYSYDDITEKHEHKSLGIKKVASSTVWQSAKDHNTTSTTSRLTTARLSRLHDF